MFAIYDFFFLLHSIERKIKVSHICTYDLAVAVAVKTKQINGPIFKTNLDRQVDDFFYEFFFSGIQEKEEKRRLIPRYRTFELNAK